MILLMNFPQYEVKATRVKNAFARLPVYVS